MKLSTSKLCAAVLLCLAAPAFCADSAPKKPLTMSDVLAASKPSDWHAPDPANTLYLELASGGRAIIELAPAFAPRHTANIKTLVREKYFDGLAFVRSHDNYVVQWGDPNADAKPEDKEQPRPFGSAEKKLKAEFTVPAKDIAFTALPDRDGYAPQTGFSGDFAVARDPKNNTAWLTHCYGTVGVGRDLDIDSGSGAELYVVITGASRWLDRNITVVGRVLQGMELLSVLPRGTGALGFYEKPEQRVPIKSIRLASDVPEAERVKLEVMRTDTATFTALIESRRNRRDDFYRFPAGHIDVCSVPLPVRMAGSNSK
jgi:peptidylprolyl isomerase